MFKQPLHLIIYLLVSLVMGISVTLVMDRFENIAVEKKIRNELEQEIRSAATSFSNSATAPTPNEVYHFIREFSNSVLSGKVIAINPAQDKEPDRRNFSFLFTYGEGSNCIDYYIVNSFLNRELAILDIPELIYGLSTTVIIFIFIVLYTEKKKQTEALNQEFEVRHEEFRKVVEEHEALALLGRMAATLAHELKTPIATISNLVQVLPDRFGDEKFTDRFVTLMNEELSRTQQLINNLLAYGKEIVVERGEWIPLAPFLDEIARKNSLRLDPLPSVDISGDRFYLSLLFDNLIRNSKGAGADTSRVTVRTAQDAPVVEISIEDNGSGFPAATDLGALLDPFVTFHASGAGLGLYLANKVAMAHNGRISLYRREQGAGVALTLPRERVNIHG